MQFLPTAADRQQLPILRDGGATDFAPSQIARILLLRVSVFALQIPGRLAAGTGRYRVLSRHPETRAATEPRNGGSRPMRVTSPGARQGCCARSGPELITKL